MRLVVRTPMHRLLALAALLFALPSQALVTFDWVPIGDPGNAPDTSMNCFGANCGSVPYTYYISLYEVTNAQYAEFLNVTAAADPLALYSTNMGSQAQGGITRSESSGSYAYAVKPGLEDKPVNFVSFYDSLRFTNWLNNGQGPGSTETGAYTLLGGTPTPSNGTTVLRNPGASVFLPSENEWYKAAYFDGATYLDYPAGTNTATVCAGPQATPNRANCLSFGVTNVGAYTGSASPYGTFDQGGNVYEWNEQINSLSKRGIRGGSWNNGALALAASFPNSTNAVEGSTVGFRVASLVPEPGSSLLAATSLLVMTGLTGLAARRRR
jgi:formylglycine-generating enzyme required for sulfatase activity